MSLLSDVLNAVSSVQCGSDLLVCLHESFQLDVEVSVLTLEHVAVGIQGVELGLQVTVSFEDVVVAEAEVVLLLSGNHKLVLDLSGSLLSFVELTLEVSVLGILIFGLALQVGLVGELAVEVSLESLGLNHKSGVVVLGSCQLSGCLLKSLGGSSHFEFLGISEF